MSAKGRLRRCLNRIGEPTVLLTLIAALTLTVLWGATLILIKAERVAAEHAAALSSDELAETYEAQVVRALREIDLTLRFVKFAYEGRGSRAALKELDSKSMLPPPMLFTVSIADSIGDVVASNGASVRGNVSDEDHFQLARRSDELAIGWPSGDSIAGAGRLKFSRRLAAADGSFAGVVSIAVDAAYFVSGYQSSKLGAHGVLGVIGVDGVFRVRRTGETISAPDAKVYAGAVPATDAVASEAVPSIDAWDGVLRYRSTRRLYEFPMAVIVGLSVDEVMAGARSRVQTYLWRTAAASMFLILIAAMLGRMSHQLAAGRRRAVEEQLSHAARIEYLAYHDGLTELPNRSLFSKLLGQTIQHAHRYERRLAVMFLDLDRFKQVNDTLGHEAGDQLLQEVAVRLKACLRDSDAVARLGGDEFVVLLPELADEDYVRTVAQKILTAIARPFVLVGHEFRVTASIGICTYPQDGLDEQTLTKNADIAMYKAKEDGKNNFRFYSSTLNANSLERLTLESSLRRALERGEFVLHYQAKRHIRTGAITGMEALLRWQHPDLGIVLPMQFLRVAEETGLIVPIGKWVLKTACLQNMAWQAQGMAHRPMAVNLTTRQFFDENLVKDLTEVLATTGMDGRLLELEIAESMLMRDVGKALGILVELKRFGFRIALGDFGVGYASLATLQRFPLDSIKIDRSLIRDAASVDEDKALTRAVMALARSLSPAVVAQGVETQSQADFLRINACDEFQGFYLDLPMPADRASAILRQEDVVPTDALATA